MPALLGIHSAPISANMRPPVPQQLTVTFTETPQGSVLRQEGAGRSGAHNRGPLWEGWEPWDIDLLHWPMPLRVRVKVCSYLRIRRGRNGGTLMDLRSPWASAPGVPWAHTATVPKRVPAPSHRGRKDREWSTFHSFDFSWLLQYFITILISLKYFYGKDLGWFYFLFNFHWKPN